MMGRPQTRSESRALRVGCAVLFDLSCMEGTGVKPDRCDGLVRVVGQAPSRRQMLRVFGGLLGAMLGMRAGSEHAGAKRRITQLPQYDYVHHDDRFQPYELPLDGYPQRNDVAERSERVEAGR